MAKTMKTWNGYEIVDDAARKDIAGLNTDVNELSGKMCNLSNGIIDVTELPKENILRNCFYRLNNVEAKFVVDKNINALNDWTCCCVYELPENPEPVSRDIKNIYAYYNIQNGVAYGYVDDFVASAAGGVPTGWYTLEQLAPAFNLKYDGVITDINDDPCDSTIRIVVSFLSNKFYTYDNGWKEFSSGGAIIDVVELPTENIRKDCFYRLLSAESFYGNYNRTEDTIICVSSLPEIGEVVTDAEISYLKLYYNTEDNGVYGYVDDTLASAFGFPSSGWIDYGTLCAFTGKTYNGVITHIDDAKDDNSFRVLLSHSLHIYKDGWKELPYGYETAPEFDIKWDGDMTDHMVLDMSALGYENLYYTKVSDIVLTFDELQGSTMEMVDIINNEVQSGIVGIGTDLCINSDMFDGAIVVTDFNLNNNFIIVVHDADALATFLGIPTGIYSNGVYFWLNTEVGHISRLVSPKKISKIDSKFIDVNTLDNLATVATTGSYNDLKNKPTIYTDVIRYNTTQSLSDAAKTKARSNINVYSKSEVDTKIANSSSNVDLSEYSKTTEIEAMISDAIGTAIGGSY